MKHILGIPKEIKTLEKRVGLTPEGVQQLCQEGFRVLVQTGAGEVSGFSDGEYQQAGAVMMNTAAELYKSAQIILKIKEPLPAEYVYLRPGLIIFSFLHLAAPSACDLVKALKDRGVTALAFETLEKEGQRPLLTPMSEIAGALSSLFAGYFLKLDLLQPGGVGNTCESSFFRFTLKDDLQKIGAAYPEKIPGVSAAGRFIIFGGGIAGTAAARYALQIGGDVSVVEKNGQRRDHLKGMFQSAGEHFQIFSREQIPPSVMQAGSIWIGAVHQTGNRALQVVDRAQMESLCRNAPKIIMDISIDQGGNFPEAIPTNYEEPLYRDSWGNVRFCVPNIPSLAGRYASARLTNAVLPYTRALASGGYDEAVKLYPELQPALNIRDGRILLDCVRDAHGL